MRAFLSVILLAVGCSGAEPVELNGEWPNKVGDFDEVNEKWTRHARDRKGLGGAERERLDQTIDVYATFKSPEWRAAHIRRQRQRHHLSQAAVNELTQKARTEDSERYEFQLLVATYDRRSNDLQKGKRSTWRVALEDDAGNEIVASEVKRDRRPEVEIRSEHPQMSDFHEPYVARFPRSVDILRPEAKKFRLKVTSAQGGVVLEWREP
jgi:hypothetical protein